MTDARLMRRFWDRRARENALYYVDNRLSYRNPDDARFWRGGEQDLAALLGRLGVGIQADDRVLEIGCGVGRLTRPIAARADHVYACDVSGRMLAEAKALNPGATNITWIETDGMSLDGIPDTSVDACVSCVVFQHIPDPQITLGYVREMGRVLRPGGWSAFQLSNDPTIHRVQDKAQRRSRWRTQFATALGRSPRGQAHPAWLGSAVDLDELDEVAAMAGMRTIRVIGRGTQYCGVLLRRQQD